MVYQGPRNYGSKVTVVDRFQCIECATFTLHIHYSNSVGTAPSSYSNGETYV